MVSRFMQKPHESYLLEAKIFLHYIHGTIHYGVFYLSKANVSLLGYTDSDWAGDCSDRWSTAGYIFQLGSGPISWSSKKLRALSLSSCECRV